MDQATQDYIDAHLSETLDDLKRLTAQPSVSAQRVGVRECGEMVVEELRKAGFEAELVPTADPDYPGIIA
ncbi:MAG: peptidase M20, partial [Chloroflexi bacterium]|nr:peptidase M20 [Chloroflexota bacterium]